jgi:hypothetical protein
MTPVSPAVPVYDLGHQGDFDYTQMHALLRLTPEQRLERHERWRLFVKEALRNARLRANGVSQTHRERS